MTTIQTRPEDFRNSHETVTCSRQFFAVLADHMRQYQAYSEAMRQEGRGLYLSSPIQPETMAAAINHLLVTGGEQPEPPAPKPRRRRAITSGPVNTSAMSDAEVYAHYKRTAHVEDVRFMMEHAHLSTELARRLAQLYVRAQDGLSRTDTLRELRQLQGEWRRERNEADRIERMNTESLAMAA